MKQGGYLPECEQGRFVTMAFAEIAYHRNHRLVFLIIFPIGRSVAGHPCAIALAFSGVPVCHQVGHKVTLCIPHFITVNVFMVAGVVSFMHKGQSMQLIGHLKGPFKDLVQREVNLQCLAVKLKLILLVLLRNKGKVPSLHFR